MGVEQYYYTSYTQAKTGNSGFQIKAMSAGITAQTQQQLARLISYRIPANLDLAAYTTHPIALRYLLTGPEQAILLCSQSSGPDDHGRPGNFFAHAVVLEPEIFRSVPPIFFWKHLFWQHADPQPREEIVSLPTLPDFQLEPSLDIDTIWDFLAQGQRKAVLIQLLSAVVQSHTTQRRILLLDSVEHVALWIAAISCLLPPDYRPFLTFTTYHHDPFQAQYLITGMTPDVASRLSPDIAASAFILDAASETIVAAGWGQAPSLQIPVSPYAEFAAAAAEPVRYETHLLPLFTDYIQRFPHVARIDEQLDLLVCYTRRLQQPRLPTPLTPTEQQAIHLALTSFEAPNTCTRGDLRELRLLEVILRRALKMQWSEQDGEEARQGQERRMQQVPYPSLSDYQRVLALFRLYALPIELIVRGELLLFTNHLLTGTGKRPVFPHLALFNQVYGEELVLAFLNTSDYIQQVLHMITMYASGEAKCLALFWRALGHAIRPASPGRELAVHSLYRVQAPLLTTGDTDEDGQGAQETQTTHLSPDEQALQHAMFTVLRIHAADWLQLMVTGTPTLPQTQLTYFYRTLTEPLNTKTRKALRTIVAPFF